MKDYSKIYNNVALNSLPRNESGPTYYTYLLDVNGIHYGLFENNLEVGTAHQFLIETNDTEVYIAGEIKIEGQNVEFNFYSGTFSLPLNLNENPLIKFILTDLLWNIFNLYNIDLKTRFTKISFTEVEIFQKIPPTLKAIRHMCLQPYSSNNVVVLEEGKRCKGPRLPESVSWESIFDNFKYGRNLLCKDVDYQYEKKYLKYKTKYIKLKEKLN
jgi:hypothetical protein